MSTGAGAEFMYCSSPNGRVNTPCIDVGVVGEGGGGFVPTCQLPRRLYIVEKLSLIWSRLRVPRRTEEIRPPANSTGIVRAWASQLKRWGVEAARETVVSGRKTDGSCSRNTENKEMLFAAELQSHAIAAAQLFVEKISNEICKKRLVQYQ